MTNLMIVCRRNLSDRILQRGLLVSIALLTATMTGPWALAEDWPQWRGEGGRGLSDEHGLPKKWSAEDNVLWRSPLPGQGGATPVIWDNTVFVTSNDGDDLVLISINKSTGNKNWVRKVTDGNEKARASEGNSASASPSTDGEHVWVMFSRGEKFRSAILACFDFDGNEIWKFDIAQQFEPIDIQFGLTSTPVLDGDSLYLQLIHGEMRQDSDARTGRVVRLNKLTGETIWNVERTTDAQHENKHSYASPFMYNDGKLKFLVAHGADCTTGHDLETGKELWRFASLNGPNKINRGKFDLFFRFVASPAVGDGMIVIPSCKRGPAVALRVDENLSGLIGEDSESIMWTLDRTPDVSIPLIAGDLVYLLDKDGKLRCVERETGEDVYYERTHNVQYRSSPVYADGHVYYCGKDGVCTVVKAGQDFEIVSENAMGGEDITASIAVSDGKLFIRTYEALYAIGQE
jgi:outer membrane protein assembly factor BamB